MYAQGTGQTHIGKHRPNNEDTFLVDNDLELYIVADGMGGQAKGERAAALAIEAAARSIAEQHSVLESVRKGKNLNGELPRLAEKAIQAACKAVYKEACASQKNAGMGTTLTLVVMAGQQAIMGHVGDSRLYLYRAGKVIQVSTDHTMAAELIRSGAFTPEIARRSPYANVLTRSVGTHPSVHVDSLAFELFPGDTLLLCSDGLSEVFPEAEELNRYLSKNVDAIPDELVEAAKKSESRDDITVVAVRIESDENEDPKSEQAQQQHRLKLRALRSCPIFESMSQSRLMRILPICKVEQFERGSWITEFGNPCDYMGMVLKGAVDVCRGEDHIGELTKGATFGVDSLLAPRNWRSDLHVAEPTDLLIFEREAFLSLLTRRPWLGIEITRRLGEYSAAMTERLWGLLDSPPSRQREQLHIADYC